MEQSAIPPRLIHKKSGFVLEPTDALFRFLSQDTDIIFGERSFPVLSTVGIVAGPKLIGVTVTYNRGTEENPIRVSRDFYSPPSQQVCKEFDGILIGTMRNKEGTMWIHPLGFDHRAGGSVWTGGEWAHIVSVDVAVTEGKHVVTVIFSGDSGNELLTFEMW